MCEPFNGKIVIHIQSPRHLATFLQEVRGFYERIGWDRKQCSIGYYENKVRMCDDNGSIDYEFQENGIIHRHSYGGYSKLIEFVDTDYAFNISRHNRAILEGDAIYAN